MISQSCGQTDGSVISNDEVHLSVSLSVALKGKAGVYSSLQVANILILYFSFPFAPSQSSSKLEYVRVNPVTFYVFSPSFSIVDLRSAVLIVNTHFSPPSTKPKLLVKPEF